MDKGSGGGGGAPPVEKDVGGGGAVRESETKRDLAAMDRATKKARIEGSSTSAAALSPPQAADMDAAAAAAPVPAPQDPPAEDIDPLPAAPDEDAPVHPPGGGDVNRELFLRVSPSVVTVALFSAGGAEALNYGTGFIISANDHYALVFTSVPPTLYENDELLHFVYLGEQNQGERAYVLCKDKKDKKFRVLIVPTDGLYEPVILEETVKDEPVITVGAMAGAKKRYDEPIIPELLGTLGMISGRVATPDCTANTLEFEHLKGSENYFEVECVGRDTHVRLEYIDDTRHTSYRLEAAPVFAISGRVLGLIRSAGTHVDVKNGYLSRSIISSLRSMCRVNNWQEELLNMGGRLYHTYANLYNNGE